MEPSINASVGQCSNPRTRVLLLYADVARAASLAMRLQDAEWEFLLFPLSISLDGWTDKLQPDLVLLSPEDGAQELLATCESVRAQTDLPVAVLAPRHDDLLIARILELGVDEYLAEPIGDRELAARLLALLRRLRRYQMSKEIISAGGLMLSSLDHTVERNGRKISLSPIEFRLLSCLLSAPGTVLTHQTLMARVWGSEYVDSRHYLRLYIRYLREKIEDDATKPQLILSEWGVGYRFQPTRAAAAAPSLTR